MLQFGSRCPLKALVLKAQLPACVILGGEQKEGKSLGEGACPEGENTPGLSLPL